MTPVELTELFGVLAAIGSSIVVPVYLNGRRERSVAEDRDERNDANLRDDQREFIAVLQNENKQWRGEVERLRETVEKLRADIEQLRTELAIERRRRREYEAREHLGSDDH